MTRSWAPRTDDTLLRHLGVEQLPTPAPLDFSEIPVVRSTYRLEAPENGQLPREAYILTHKVVALDGAEYSIQVLGHPEFGLPYGNDADILLAIFKLADEQRVVNGLFTSPSIRAIAQAIGKPPNGETSRRIHEALRRLGHVRIQTNLVRHTEQLALEIQGGRAHPLLPNASPTRTIKTTEEEELKWVLEYKWVRESRRRVREDGGDEQEFANWIEHLRLNPLWLHQAVAGWAAWIDVHKFARLTSPIAKRLYQVCAGQAAKGVESPWLFDLEYLRSSCAMSAKLKPARARDSIVEAGEQLKEHGILSSVQWVSPQRGRYMVAFEPGHAIRSAGWLRGVGLLDLREVRTQLMVLAYFGIVGTAARALVYEKPDRVQEVLRYAIFLRETNPQRIRKSWAGFIVDAIQNDRSFSSEPEFQRWLNREEAAAPTAAVEKDGSSVATPAPAPAPREVPRCEAAPRDPAAAELWVEALKVSDALIPAGRQVALQHLAPIEFRGAALVCWANNDIYVHMVERSAETINTLLSQLTDGRIRQLIVELEPHA